MTAENDLARLGEAVAERVPNGARLGLGTGRAAAAFVHALARRVAGGLRVVGVPSSEATRRLAQDLGIPLASLDEVAELDVTIDGADEVDPELRLIKGLGGALVREKILAAAARELWIVVGEEKLVPRLGVKSPVPVEVLGFGRPLAERRLIALGATPHVRRIGGGPLYETDNGNPILDCRFSGIEDPEAVDAAIRSIPGVVGTGLFVGLTTRVFVQHGRAVRVLEKSP